MFENNLLAGVSGQGGAYSIEDSLRFNRNDSAYLSRTPATAGNRKKWTWSGWVKRGNVGINSYLFGATSDNYSLNWDLVAFSPSDNFYVQGYAGSQTYAATLNGVFRDVSGWYHIVITFDTTEATTSDRIKIYVNGVYQSFNSPAYPSQNLDTFINSTNIHTYGSNTGSTTTFDGYLAETNFIDGQALTADDFGHIDATTGEWSPKKYSGTYGTNGFYLPFNGNANDSSGNGNNWTENNLASTDYMIDTPTNNFAIWNPLAVSSATFSQGNLNAVMSSSTPSKITSTFAVSSGKYFMEYEYKGNNNWPVGISADAIQRDYLGMSDGNTSISFWCGTSATSVYINGVSQSFSGSATTWTSGDIVGVALDADNQEVSLYKNGTLVGSSVSYSTYGWSQAFFAAGNYISGNQYISNFGQDSSFAGIKTRQGNTDANGIGDFYYEPPTGYLALCEDNLETLPFSASGGTETTITDGGVDYKVHTFTSSDTLYVQGIGEVEYLVVAGGGGGAGGNQSGAGGAGGVVTGTTNVSASSYTIMVGAGGAREDTFGDGNNGNNSVAVGITALGGGGGGAVDVGLNGGSGGGAKGGSASVNVGGSGLQPASASSGSGNDGGDSLAIDSGDNRAGAGGGGAGEAGANAGVGAGGDGGNGIVSTISGSSQYYGGGGGGGHRGATNHGTGGLGGGGDGWHTTLPSSANGAANTGGGGGGQGLGPSSANPRYVKSGGGSGIVIIRYPL